MLETLNAIRAERPLLVPVNPKATYQGAYREWVGSTSPPRPARVASPPRLPITATVHGFTLPTALVVEARISPKKMEAAKAAARRPLPRTKRVDVPLSSTVSASTLPLAANRTNIAQHVDLDRLRATAGHRRGRGKTTGVNEPAGYTLIELKTIATALDLSPGGLKADVLARILNVVGPLD